MKKYSWHNKNGMLVEAIQEQLNLEQNVEIIKIFSDFDVTSIQDLVNVNAKALLDKLTKQELIYSVFMVVLKPVKQALTLDDIKSIPSDALIEIWNDFFFFNARMLKPFVNFLGEIGSFLMTAQIPKKARLRKRLFSWLRMAKS